MGAQTRGTTPFASGLVEAGENAAAVPTALALGEGVGSASADGTISLVGTDMLTGLELAELRSQDLTYAGAGRTRADAPPGFRLLRRSLVVGTGVDRFEEAARTLLAWDVHRGAGVRVRPSSDVVAPDVVAVLRLGGDLVGVEAPVRVVYVIEEDRRKGFAYGTLPGHPESGEEAFVVELLDTGEVRFTIHAFSRPATTLARLGGPVSWAVQRRVTHRYLHAI